MNIKIAFCDDSPEHHNLMKEFLKIYYMEFDDEITAEYFSSGSELISSYEQGNKYHAIFMDVEMPGENGIDICAMIKNKFDYDLLPCFITSYPDYMQNSFSVHPFDYLLKPIKYIDFKKTMSRIYEHFNKSAYTLTIVNSNRAEEIVAVDDIIYIQAQTLHFSDTKLAYFLKSGKIIYSRTKLSKIEAELCEVHFIKPHRSYLVNVRYIRKFSEGAVELTNGMILPLSRNGAARVKSKYTHQIIRLRYKHLDI